MAQRTDILKQLENHFAWNPNTHTPGTRREAYTIPESDPFRQATFYDMHLATSHVCKKLVHIKNLHRKICAIVDEKLMKIQEEGTLQPPTVPGFIDNARRDANMVTMGGPLRSQKAVEDYYWEVSSFCLPIASSLAIHPKLWSRVITWSRVPEHQGIASYGASMQFIPLDKAKERLVPDFVAPELLEQLQKVKAHSNDLATWEIRSLSAKDTDAMLGVLTMALASGEGGFRWKFCSGAPCTPILDSTTKMLNSTRPADASATLHLLEESWEESELPVDRGASKTMNNPASILDDSLRRGGSSIRSVREDIYSKEAEPYIPWDSESETETAARAASKEREIDEMSWAPPGPGHTASQELIQKAWGQSVRQDSTLLILHAGNYEYVCIRHRESQTLYISDILHAPFLKDPGYGKVQVAIYIMAIDDALRRICSDDTGDGPSTPARVAEGSLIREDDDAPQNIDTTESHGAAGNKLSKRRSGVRSKKGQRSMGFEWTIQQAASRQFLLLHLRYHIYDTINPEIFHRMPVVDSDEEITPEPVTLVSVVPPDARLLLYINGELGQGATGVVHGGLLEVESGHKSSRIDIAAKLSFSEQQRNNLQQEWSVYKHLASEGIQGIPIALGIFHDPELQDKAPLCLLMSHVGMSLQTRGMSITSAQRKSFLEILKSIHQAGVIHGDLRYDNLMISASDEVAIIDFDRAIINATESDKKEECRELRRLLNRILIDDPAPEDTEPEGGRRHRGRTRRHELDQGQVLGRVTRSMGTARETLGGMRLRPRH